MTFSFKKILNTNPASATIADDHLVLSFPHAIEPVVWRMALDKVGTASFEVKKEDGSNNHKLILKPKKGTAEIIATFDNKDSAIDALMTASDAFSTQSVAPQRSATTKQTKMTGQNDAPANIPTPSSEKEGGKWALVLFGALTVIGIYYYLTTLMPIRATTGDSLQNSTAYNSSANPQQSTGVPVSADDFLNGL